MIILGAGGHAKEVFEVLKQNRQEANFALFDDVTPTEKWPAIFRTFTRIKTGAELKYWFLNNSNKFLIGVGGIASKTKLWEIGILQGGEPQTLLAANAIIGSADTNLGKGCTVMQLAFISSSVTIGDGVLINTRANIHHDVTIGDFSEIGPSSILLGKCSIGKSTFVGAGAIILPEVIVGNDCTIGAGAVVTKNISNGQIVKGNPAK